LVSIRDLGCKASRLSKVTVRECTITDYDEITLQGIGRNGIVKIINDPEKKPVNAAALERQRLHKGDIVFGYRGKLGKIGLVAEEHPIPLVGNHGMMRLSFKEGQNEETPRFVLAYLQTPLIRSFIDSMLEDNKITVSLVESIPIPKFDEMEGMSVFATVINKRQAITQEAEELFKKCIKREEEVLLLSRKPFSELSQLNAIDNNLLADLQSLAAKVEVSIPMKDNLLQQSFV